MRNLASRLTITSLLLLSLTGCSSSLFDKDNLPEPSQLPQFTPQVSPRQVWSSSTGSGGSDEYLKMSPAMGENAIYTASMNGAVTAISKTNGRTLWRSNTPLSVTAGPGAGDGIVVIGGQHGDVMALDQSSGKTRWQASVPGEILAPPAVGDGIAVIKTVNGYVRALSVSDGHLIWSHQTAEPNLVLRGASTPRITDSHVIVGFANGQLANLNAADGQMNWRQSVAIPEGAFAIQRMIDIDADPVIYDRHIYAATYQGKITSLAWGSGDILWSNSLSSYTGMSVDNNTVYISDAKGHLWAFDSGNGHEIWQESELEYRNISGPAVMGQYVVVGDSQGFLHWINKNTGKYVGRAYVDNSGIYASPIVENGVLYALSNKGNLVAYKIH